MSHRREHTNAPATDEESIEWDLTEFAIEDSMVKRR